MKILNFYLLINFQDLLNIKYLLRAMNYKLIEKYTYLDYSTKIHIQCKKIVILCVSRFI